MTRSRSLEELVNADDYRRKLARYLEERTHPVVVAFVDLADSTRLKNQPQADWLPLIARFLLTVAQLAEKCEGRVVKYVGDEVISVFDNQDGLAGQRVESFLWECESSLAPEGDEYVAKYAFDFGQGARIEPASMPEDILGTCVDRCARISKIAKSGTAVASAQFVAISKNKKSWRRIGSCKVRGLSESAVVYQLRELGDEISLEEARASVANPLEVLRSLKSCKGKLTRCHEELQVFRSRSAA